MAKSRTEVGTLDFVTMGMFIVDEIHFKPPKAPEIDVLGGAGSWSVVGARLFRPAPASRNISWIVHRGSDFPDKLAKQIESWQTSCSLINTPDRLTTRGWNSYGDDEARAFKYTTPKLRIDETQLSDRQVEAKCFHLICSPTRCVSLVQGILARRRSLNINWKPRFVWEPVPDICNPEELENAFEALKHVDVISPNHQELAAFFGKPAKTSNPTEDQQTLTACCLQLLQKGFPTGQGAVVVRCGERGCLWMEGRDCKPKTLPAWHRPDVPEIDSESHLHVTDPTGAGNAFLGGFCTGLIDDLEDSPGLEQMAQAVMYGVVSASFAIEQVGLPILTHTAGEEMWNGDSVARRLEVLKKRMR